MLYTIYIQGQNLSMLTGRGACTLKTNEKLDKWSFRVTVTANRPLDCGLTAL